MEFQQLIQQRRSVRAYKAETPVTREELDALISAMKMAPTWKNSQTGRYYIVTEPAKLEEVRGMLPAFNQRSSANASALIVTTFVKDVSGFTQGNADNEAGNLWGAYDLGLQNAYLILAATDMGLDTLIMGLRDADAIRASLEIPGDEVVMAVIALGRREGEAAFRGRKENSEIAKIF